MTIRVEEYRWKDWFDPSYVLYTDDDGWTDPPLSPDDPIGEIYGRTPEEARDYANIFRQAPEAIAALSKLHAALQPLIDGFDDNPGVSDLDDEQPIYIHCSLGDWRKARRAYLEVMGRAGR